MRVLIFREKDIDIRPKSVCADEMTIYVHCTCININRKDVRAWMISFNRKICIKNMGVYHSFEKNETATMCFLENLL